MVMQSAVAAAAVMVVKYEKEKVAIVIALAAIDTSLKCISLVAVIHSHTHTHPFSLYLPSSLACYIGNWFCLQQYCVVVAVAVQRFLCADLALVHQILAMVYELHELTSHTHKFI